LKIINGIERSVGNDPENEPFDINSVLNNSTITASSYNGSGEFSQNLFVKDWGGRVVVTSSLFDLNNKKLIDEPIVYMELPFDSDVDFLPDRWEEKFNLIPGANYNNPIKDGLDDSEDLDLTGFNHIHNEKGDGFTALEEYRGFQVTDNATGVSKIYRMEDIPLSYGGVAGLALGPQIKDLFIFHQSIVNEKATGLLEMEATNAELFNIAFHKVMKLDLFENQLDTTATHNHSINFNGMNDKIDIIQNIIHIHDDTNLPAFVSGNVNTQLNSGVLGSSGGFTLDNIDLRIKASAAGGSFGFADNLINGNTIFHEIGHKCSLKHCFDSMSDGLAAFNVNLDPLNNTDIFGDGILDGAVRVRISTYSVIGSSTDKRARGVLNEGVKINGNFYFQTHQRNNTDAIGNVIVDSTNQPIDITLVFNNIVMPMITSFESKVYLPSLLDWMDYWQGPITGGPNLQSNLNANQLHVNQKQYKEIRIKTIP